MKTKLILLYGGKSPEHEVSLITAFSVINAIDLNKFEAVPIYITHEGQWIKGPEITSKLNFVDQLRFLASQSAKVATSETEQSTGVHVNPAVPLEMGKNVVVFPLLHGPNGEDGTIQGLLEVLNVPYVGNGVLASASAMDKIIMKKIFAEAGIPQVPSLAVRKKDWEKSCEIVRKIEEKLTYPIFVKPANLGSSVGINKAANKDELYKAMDEAFLYDRRVIVEEGVVAREIETAVLGNDTPVCSAMGEILPKGDTTDFYDYKAKYQDDSTKLVIPAEIDTSVAEKIKEYAIQAFLSIDGSGLARADFFLTADHRIFLNEINTIPGFTPISMYPLLWKESGVPYDQLIEQLVELARNRHEVKNQLKHKRED